MNIRAVIGPPGTGKTSYIVKYIDDTGPGTAVTLLSLTNSAVDELKERLSQRENPAFLKYVGTIHKLAMQLTGITPDRVVDTFKEYARERGIPYREDVFASSEIGNLLQNIYEYIIHTNNDNIEYYLTSFVYYKHFDKARTAASLLDDFVKWKERKGLYTFGEVIKRAVDSGARFETDIVIVDEAQDLSPLMVSFVTDVIRAREYVFVGDPMQTIYTTLYGADGSYLLDIPKRDVLSYSHRVPSRVWNLAVHYASKLGVGDIYSSINTRPGGYVGVLPRHSLVETAVRLSGRGRVLILAKDNALVKRLAIEFLKRGYVVKGFKGRPLPFVVTAIIEAVHSLEKGQELETTDEGLYTRLLRYLQKEYREAHDALTSPLYSPEQKKEILVDVLKDYTTRRFGAVIDTIEGTEVSVIIDTYHASKGREADYVFLLDKKRIFAPQPDKLLSVSNRVYFVGITRSREGVFEVVR